MNTKFTKDEVTKMVNEATNEAWSKNVQDNSYKQLALELQNMGVAFTPKQMSALKISFNHIGIMSTKQSLAAMLNLFDKLGIISYDD